MKYILLKLAVSALIVLLLMAGCGAKKAMVSISRISEGIVSYGGAMCLRTSQYFILAVPDSVGRIVPRDTLKVPIPIKARLLEYSPTGNRIFFTSGDSVFAYDITSGLFYTLTRGKFSEYVQCGRASQDGQFLAFTASSWSIGNINFWRLVIVDAVEGGIVHYCDSMPSPYMFQWVKPARLGYAEYRYARGELDTVGMFYDVNRQIVLPARDSGIEFLKIECNPNLSPDGKWTLEVMENSVRLRNLSRERGGLQNP